MSAHAMTPTVDLTGHFLIAMPAMADKNFARTLTLDIDQVKAFAREQLTGYKVPRHVEFRDSLPKSNVGKILRRELR